MTPEERADYVRASRTILTTYERGGLAPTPYVPLAWNELRALLETIDALSKRLDSLRGTASSVDDHWCLAYHGGVIDDSAIGEELIERLTTLHWALLNDLQHDKAARP